MHNWSTDVEKIKKDPDKYAIWRLEQLINYGLEDSKLNEEELRKHLPKLSLDPARRKFIEILLYEK